MAEANLSRDDLGMILLSGRSQWTGDIPDLLSPEPQLCGQHQVQPGHQLHPAQTRGQEEYQGGGGADRPVLHLLPGHTQEKEEVEIRVVF